MQRVNAINMRLQRLICARRIFVELCFYISAILKISSSSSPSAGQNGCKEEQKTSGAVCAVGTIINCGAVAMGFAFLGAVCGAICGAAVRLWCPAVRKFWIAQYNTICPYRRPNLQGRYLYSHAQARWTKCKRTYDACVVVTKHGI